MIENANNFIEIKNVVVNDVDASINNLNVNAKAIKAITSSLKIFFTHNLVMMLKSIAK